VGAVGVTLGRLPDPEPAKHQISIWRSQPFSLLCSVNDAVNDAVNVLPEFRS
jgi:hypothetical protein